MKSVLLTRNVQDTLRIASNAGREVSFSSNSFRARDGGKIYVTHTHHSHIATVKGVDRVLYDIGTLTPEEAEKAAGRFGYLGEPHAWQPPSM